MEWTRRWLVVAVALGVFMTMSLSALAGPPPSWSDDGWNAWVGFDDGESISVWLDTQLNPGDEYPGLWVDIWVGEVNCTNGDSYEGWGNVDGQLGINADFELSCTDGSTKQVSIAATWDYEGKWGSYMYREPGLQCKGKILRDGDASVDVNITGEIEVGAVDVSGDYAEKRGSCKETAHGPRWP